MKTEIIKIDGIAWQLKIALLFAILCFGIGLVTAIPQQDYTLYGTATLNGKVLTAQDDAVISLKVEGIELVSYTMGDIPGTDNYVLIVPLDSEPGVTTAAQEGDTAYIYINGIAINEGVQIIGAPGTTVQFDISATPVSKVTVLYPNGGESIPIGTRVEVSARATDDNAVTGVTFYYSSGTNWNLIGAGARVSGTNKDGIWDKAWDTNGLSAGTNYLINAVASDGTLTRDDQSDSTFSLTPSKVIRVPVDYPTIQGAVDAARAGNTIIVGDGIYTENVKVNKSLTIKSTSGNPADTIVLAADPDADVFSVTADYVNISGLTVQGAKGWLRAGIQLNSANNCIISNNNVSNNFYGIQLQDSLNNCIYLNGFINNADTVHSLNSTNIWNSPSKITYTYNGNSYTSYLGNYWEDYTGSDADGDGIGDTPYSINLDKDFYPLLMPVENYIKQPTNITDTTSPKVSIISPEEGRIYTMREIPLEVSANEPVSRWSYDLNGAAPVTFTPNTWITAREGDNSLVIYAEDFAGNVGAATVSFRVFTVAPTITNVKVSPTSAFRGASINIFADVFDPSGVRGVKAFITKEGESVSTVFMLDPDGDGVYTGTWRTLSIYTESGIYSIDISATDTEGNEALVKAPEVEIT
jgi:parallel beta-helix repeat protein